MANEGQPGIKGELNWILILTLAQSIQTTIAPSAGQNEPDIFDTEWFSAKSLSSVNPDRAHTKWMFCF